MPQGSVLGPLLFLIVIDSIANLDLTCKIGIFADDTRTVKSVKDTEDADTLQKDLDCLYRWADNNNMSFNCDKFECLKYGRNHDVKSQYEYKTPVEGITIDDCENLRDLGITMSSDGTYDKQISKVISKAKQKVAWITRSFYRKDMELRRRLWRTYVESAMDYGSQLWSPINTKQLSNLESVLKGYLANTEGLESCNHWERLKRMKLSSVERRHERYKIFYIWKVVNGLCPNFGISWKHCDKSGLMIRIPVMNSKVPAQVKTLREQTLKYHGGNLFNAMPHYIREWKGTKEGFKVLLDTFLSQIPDNPVIPGLTPAPICRISCKNSNSIIAWIRHLGLSDRRPPVRDNSILT